MAAALVLSFIFPGLGHLYLGDKKRTTLFMGLAILSFVLGVVGVGYFMYPLVWVCGLISVFRVASRQPN